MKLNAIKLAESFGYNLEDSGGGQYVFSKFVGIHIAYVGMGSDKEGLEAADPTDKIFEYDVLYNDEKSVLCNPKSHVTLLEALTACNKILEGKANG